MRRLILVAFCVTVSLSGASAGGKPISYGMTMTSRAYDAVCWYETLKVFPETNSKGFGQCNGKIKFSQNFVENPNEQNKKFMESSPDGAQTLFTMQLKSTGALKKLPNGDKYESACGSYVENAKAEPPADESDVLKDKSKKNYPYKALAHCLMKTLRDIHGDEAIEAVKSEKTHALKHWMTTIYDRENEFRKRHGVEPLKLSKDLTDAAQEWADKNAAECQPSRHSKNSDPGRQWHGASTGESLSAAGGEEESQNAAYMAADGWYEEIKDYPFPDGYQGGNEALFKKIGHFTQSVWKKSEYVGYGYAYNKDCKPYTQFITSRYSPAGNLDGAYPENVNPPQD